MNKYCKTLKAGDLIVVAYNNVLRHAVWLGLGKLGNPQFVLLPFYDSDVKNWETNDHRIKRLKEKGKIYKDYIVRKYDGCIAKISEEELGDDDRAAYIGIANLLKDKGII